VSTASAFADRIWGNYPRREVTVTCAAITSGCAAWLYFDSPPNVDIHHLDPLVPEDAYVRRVLAGNGWRMDCGRWVCPAHPR
jgi:hypothetical protein